MEKPAPNGWYDTATGKIYIDLYAGQTARGTMLFTIAHELTHFIRQNSPAKFDALADIVVNKSNLKGKVSERIEQKMNEAKDRRDPISRDTAYEEVIADSMETILTSGRVFEMMNEIQQQDKTLWEQIRDWFIDFIKSIREAYKGVEADTVEGQAIAEMDDVLKELEQIFAEGLVDAGENFQTAEKNTTDSGKVYQIRQIGNTGKFYVQADRQVITGDDSNAWGKQIEEYINEQIRHNQDVAIPTSDGHILLLTARSSYKLKDNHVSAIEKKVEAMLDDEMFALKGRAATHIDELIQVARFKGYESDKDGKHENDIGEDGFNYYEAYFLDFDGRYYLVPFSAGINEAEETTYSIGRIRQRRFPADTGSSSKKEALKSDKKSSKGIIYSSNTKSQELKTAIELAYENALKKKYAEAEKVDVDIDPGSESVAPSVLKSERTWKESDYVQERDKAAAEIAKAIGVTEQKAKDYIESVKDSYSNFPVAQGIVDSFVEEYKSNHPDKLYSRREIIGPSGTNYGEGVYLDSTFLDGLTDDERIQLIRDYITELGGSKFQAYDQSGRATDVLLVESTKKFVNRQGRRVPVLKDLKFYIKPKVKQEAIALIDEVFDAAKYVGKEPANHPHDWVDNNGQNDWDVWETYLQEKNNTVWKAKLRTANSVNGEKILYEIFPIEKVEEAQAMGTTTTNPNVAQPIPNVNNNNSTLNSNRADENTSTRSFCATPSRALVRIERVERESMSTVFLFSCLTKGLPLSLPFPFLWGSVRPHA